MQKLKPITTELLEIDHQDNLVTSTKTWIKEIKEDIKNGIRRIQKIRYN
jgi:hypothetical protein